MADDSKEYEIWLRTKADASGAEVTKKATDEVTEATEKATAATKASTDAVKQETAAMKERNAVPSPAATPTSGPGMPGIGGREPSSSEAERTAAAVKQAAAATKEQASAAEGVRVSLNGQVLSAEELAELDERRAKRLKEEAEQAKAAADASADGNEKLEKIINLQRVEMAGKLAGFLGQMAQGARDFAKELKGADKEQAQLWENVATGAESAKSAMELAVSGFAIGGPFGAAAGALVGFFVGPLKNALNDIRQATINQANSTKLAADLEKKYQEAIERRAAAARSARTLELYQMELNALLQIGREIDRQKLVRESWEAANKAARDNADQAAIRTGTPAAQVKQTRIVDDASDELDGLNRDILEAKKKVDLANEAIAAYRKAYERLIAQGDQASADDQMEKMVKAEGEAQALTDELEKLILQRPGKIAGIIEAASSRMWDVEDEINSDLEERTANFEKTKSEISEAQKKQAQDAIDAINASAKEGEGVSDRAAGIIAGLVELMGDKISDAEQAWKFRDAILALKNTQEGSNKENVDLLNEMATSAQANWDQFQNLLRTVQEMKTQHQQALSMMRQLMSDVRAQGQQINALQIELNNR
jgi:hypothetical protein